MHGDAAAVGTEDADAGAIAGGQGSSNGAGRRCGAHRGRKRFWQTRDESRHALLGQLVGHAPHFGIVIRLPLWQRSGLRAIGAVNGHGRCARGRQHLDRGAVLELVGDLRATELPVDQRPLVRVGPHGHGGAGNRVGIGIEVLGKTLLQQCRHPLHCGA
ncbi:hypothetical protein G6F46_014340 [Rhizopus delemar]|nr:hypothetical protein G6F46_014340 [Rhizopus delemar]